MVSLVHYSHSSGVSYYFALLFLHIIKGLYAGSNNSRNVWSTGSTIWLASAAVAFLGYVCTWGSMRLWAGMVIIGLFVSIPDLC